MKRNIQTRQASLSCCCASHWLLPGKVLDYVSYPTIHGEVAGTVDYQTCLYDAIPSIYIYIHVHMYIYICCVRARVDQKWEKSHNSSSCKSSPLWCIERVAPVQCSLCVCPLPKWSCSGSPALASGSTCFWEARKTREQSTCWLVSVGYIGFCQTSYHRIQTIGQRLCLRFGWKGQSAKSNALQLWYLTRSWTRFGSHKYP